MIYLDNSASTYYKPLSVKWAVLKALFLHTANAGRSGHTASRRSADAVYDVREVLAKAFGGEPDRVVFTSGCTESLNLAIRGSAREGGHIITTCFEHNSVLRTLEYLKEQGKIDYTVVSPKSKDFVITTEELEAVLKSNTYMLIVNHISNVVGVKQDISTLGKWAKEKGLLFLVDGAQSAGHEKIDIKSQSIDMLALAGHKGLYGLCGIGALVIGEGVSLAPIKYGGTGTFSESLKQPNGIPEGLESGTLPIIPIISMGKGCEYAYKTLDIRDYKEKYLTQKIISWLKALDGVIVYTPDSATNGVVAFNIKGKDASEVADILNDKYNIAVRSGLQCAPLVHRFLGTIDGGVVRASIGRGNTIKQIDKFIQAVKEII